MSPATLREFEAYRAKTQRTSDDLVRYFLRTEAEPGQAVILLSEDVGKSFDAVKHGLKTNPTNCMKHLLHVREKYM